MGWRAYVQRVTRRASQQEVARRLRIAPSGVSRWKVSEPKPETVRVFTVADIRRRHAGPLLAEEPVEAIWALEALPEATRRLLILEYLERERARAAGGPRSDSG